MPSAAEMRQILPSGKYVQSGGTEVFSDRRYQPIQRKCGITVEPVKPDEKITFVRQEWFFTDANPPWRNRQTLAKCRDILRGLGIECPC
jgi:hypothetical protein